LLQQRAAIVDAAEKYDPVLCLFSDGGVCSNFPLHMFDSPLPLWPTFGVNLKPFHPDHPNERTWLPEAQGAGILSHIHAPEGKTGLSAIVEFVWSIVATMQNWRDNLLASTPGYRDRIVHISHGAEEGGLNLNMPEALITEMASSGQEAARLLYDKFAAAGSSGWDEHRVTRMRSLLGLLEDKLNDVAKSYPGGGSPTYQELIARPAGTPPDNYRFRSGAQMGLAKSVLDELKKIADGIGGSGNSLADGQPKPVPEFRITPRF
jgi:hypothetical protein